MITLIPSLARFAHSHEAHLANQILECPFGQLPACVAQRGEALVPKLGILALNLSAEIRALLPDLRRDSGVVVAARLPSALVSREGALTPGDVIHAVNNQPVRTLAEFRNIVDRLTDNDAAVLQIERAGELMFLGFRIE